MALACLTSMLLYHLSCYLHFKDNRPRNEHPPPFLFILRWLRVFLNYPPTREFEVSEASEVLEVFLGCPVIFGFLVLLKSFCYSLEVALPRGWVTCFLGEASSWLGVCRGRLGSLSVEVFIHLQPAPLPSSAQMARCKDSPALPNQRLASRFGGAGLGSLDSTVLRHADFRRQTSFHGHSEPASEVFGGGQWWCKADLSPPIASCFDFLRFAKLNPIYLSVL